MIFEEAAYTREHVRMSATVDTELEEVYVNLPDVVKLDDIGDIVRMLTRAKMVALNAKQQK